MVALSKKQEPDVELREIRLPIERRIADALRHHGEFIDTLGPEELEPILTNVLFMLVGEQKLAGIDIPIQHNVTSMEVEICQQEAHIFCELHIHAPIMAFIRFRYVLVNDPRSNPANLRVKNNELHVDEITRKLDLGAKAALKVMNVRKLALAELSDPAYVIQRTLPHKLNLQGYTHDLGQIELRITPENLLHVHIRA